MVVKAGGDVIDDSFSAGGNQSGLLESVKDINQSGARVIFCYGAQHRLSSEMERLGMTPEFVNGLRVSNADFMQKVYLPVIYFVGGMLAKFFSGKAAKDTLFFGDAAYGRRISEQLGFVGEFEVAGYSVIRCLNKGQVAVVSPVALSVDSEQGFGPRGLLNLNADSIASGMAEYHNAAALYLATNVDGVVLNSHPIESLTVNDCRQLVASGAISGGMAQKVANAARAVDHGVPKAVIFNGVTGSLYNAMEGRSGTAIVK